MTPSLRIEPPGRAIACSGAILSDLRPGRRRAADLFRVTRQPQAVVGISEVRRERGAVGDRAPRVGVAPRAAPADAAVAGPGPARVALRRIAVVVLAEPVGAP